MDAFWEGFEHQKEARLKELALAGMLAATPMKAKADMWQTVGQAAQAQFGKYLQPKAVQKIQQATSKGVSIGGGGAAKSIPINASLRDFSKLRLERGPLSAELSPSQLTAQYKVHPNVDVSAGLSGGEKRIGFNFRKDF